MSIPVTDRHVDEIADRYVEEYAALDPISAAYMGIDGYGDRLTDYSPEAFDEREALTRKALADATAAVPVDEREAATLALSLLLAQVGVWGLRVHDVRSTRDALRVLDALETAREEGRDG